MHASRENKHIGMSLLTTTLKVKENTFWCKMRVFALLTFSEKMESHTCLFTSRGGLRFMSESSSWFPRGTIHPDHFLWLSIKHALKDVPSLCLQLWFDHQSSPDRGPWPVFSFKCDHILLGVPPSTSPAIEFVFLNNHLIQIPIIFLRGHINNMPKLSRK